jgi:hypothetical protein
MVDAEKPVYAAASVLKTGDTRVPTIALWWFAS